MNLAQSKKLLATVKAEELFSEGQLFSRMDKGEPIFWRVLEATDTDKGRRVTFHLYHRDVFLRVLIGLLTPEGKVKWGVR